MSVRVLNKEGLLAIIQGLVGVQLGLSPNAVTWALDPQPMISDQDRARVTLQVFGMSALAVDEHRTAYGPPGYPANAFVTTELGNRHIKITIKAEAFDSSVEASEVIDAIRTGIRSYASTQALDAISLAFVEAEQATPVRLVLNEREVNMAVCDFTFAGVAQLVSSVAVDGSGNDITWIQTVNGNNVVPGTFLP